MDQNKLSLSVKDKTHRNVESNASSSTSVASIFGVDPLQDNFICEASGAFECWKGWKKASACFYQGSNQEQYLVNGPYFLRAASFWKKTVQWCNEEQMPGNMGSKILETFTQRPGLHFNDWDYRVRSRPGILAAQAVFAFFGGQDYEGSRTRLRGPSEFIFAGLLGGYQAYNYYSSTWLSFPRYVSIDGSVGDPSVLVGLDYLSMQTRINKLFYIDSATGGLFLKDDDGADVHVLNQSPKPDDFLLWLEEYGRRLEIGEIGVGVMGCHPNDPASILLYPRLPRGATTITEGVQNVSRAVTRGVEVVASAVYAPQCMQQFGFIYSIRIRLLTPGEEGYLSPSDRGFFTCQLNTRHWSITNDATGETDRVDGPGVIGMYPVLLEGGYIEDGEQCTGTFQYQSCTGTMQGGSFGGNIEFVPGRRNSPTGSPFNVELRPFALESRPSYLY